MTHSYEDEHDEWIQWLSARGVEGAWLALLIPSLPNLKRLDLTRPACDDIYFTQMINRALSKEKPFETNPLFPALEIVVNNWSDFNYSTSPELLAKFLTLSTSLCEFYGQRIVSLTNAGDAPNELLAQLKPASLSLTRLELRQSNVHGNDLSNIFRACKALKTFVHVLGFAHVRCSEYSMPGLHEALLCTKDSLENLMIDYENGPNYLYHGEKPPMESLTMFERLRCVKVGMYVLFGGCDGDFGLGDEEVPRDEWTEIDLVEWLPRGVETLYVSHTDGRVGYLVWALERMLLQMIHAGSTPKLRKVTFEAYITGHREKIDFEKLDDIAGKAGVEIMRIDGTALQADDSFECKFTEWIKGRGQDSDGSCIWAAAEAISAFVDAGR